VGAKLSLVVKVVSIRYHSRRYNLQEGLLCLAFGMASDCGVYLEPMIAFFYAHCLDSVFRE